MSVLPLLSIAASYIIIEMMQLNAFFKRVLAVLMFSALVFQMIYLTPEGLSKVYQRMLVLIGLRSQEEYISRNEETYLPFKYINDNLPGEAKVWILNETRTFYCDREYVTVAPPIHDVIKDTGKVLSRLKGSGITHLLFNAGADRHYYDNIPGELKENYLELLYDEYPFQVFKIHYE